MTVVSTTPEVLEQNLKRNPDAVQKTVQHSNCTDWLHDSLPLEDRCGICLFDDLISICCYDGETGALQATFDTGSFELVDWAEAYYDRLRGKPTRSMTRIISYLSIHISTHLTPLFTV